MSFENDIAQALARQGVSISPSQVPSREQFAAGVTKLAAFFRSLDADTVEILDEVSADFPIKAVLAQPDVGIAPELDPVFRAIDSSGRRLSLTAMNTLFEGVLSAPQPPPPPSTPVVTAMSARQFTLREQSSFTISWSSGRCDKYHLSWHLEHPVPGSTNSGNVQEIAAPASFTFTSRISGSLPGEIYRAQVQACRSVDLGSDSCSPFSDPATVTIPANTRSLRQFLLLSGVTPPVSMRAIGMGPDARLGASVRALLRV